jgi:hypothetical protein
MNSNYDLLSKRSIESLSDNNLLFCIQHLAEIGDTEDLKDYTEEFDRRHNTELRAIVAEINNAFMHLFEGINNARSYCEETTK